jgi:hypothetical protein
MWVWGALPTGLAMFDAMLMTAIAGAAVGHAMLVWRRRLEAQRFLAS